MGLDLEDVTKITIEVILGRRPTIKGEEADAVRAKIAEQVERMRKKGQTVRLPE